MGYQRIEKIEHVIFISKYKQENSNTDNYSLKVNIMIPHFISVIAFDHKSLKKSSMYINISLLKPSQTCKLCLNICCYVFVTIWKTGCFGLLDDLSAKFESCICNENYARLSTLFLFPFPASFEFEILTFTQSHF